jgi:hypothetical protein
VIGPAIVALVAAGESADYPHDFDIVVARLDEVGAPVTTFGNGGIVTVALPHDDLAEDVSVRPDGRIVVGGAHVGSVSSKMLAVQLQG